MPTVDQTVLTTGRLVVGDDTIVAVATPQGRGALSVVRLSGSRAHDIARSMSERWPDRARQVVLTPVHNAAGEVLDEALLTRFDAPASFTGENMVEISAHGGLVVCTTIVAAAITNGARPAEPGEFTRRAVLNGKLDILQAEAVGELIDANSRAAQRVALNQLAGGLSRRIEMLRDRVLGIEALIAYDIDFPEEDDGPIDIAHVLGALEALESALDELLKTAKTGELVREGAVVVLAGAPNVGKSSLFNAILGLDRAIVTDVPGTTRDAIEAVVDIGSIPIRLVDTAGIRETTDVVERLGVEVSEKYLERADLVLVCGDSFGSLQSAAERVREAAGAPLVLVHTKSDIAGADKASMRAIAGTANAVEQIAVSAETGLGMAELVSAVERAVLDGASAIEMDAPLLTQTRHRSAIERGRAEVAAFRRAWLQDKLPATIAAVHLREAADSLQELIGGVDVEQVLDEVFRRFCVGK